MDISSQSIDLSATSTTTDAQYALHIDLYKPIVASSVRKTLTGSHLFLVLSKADLGEAYWPRLTANKARYNYIRTDFDRWVDEDEQEDEEEEGDFMGGNQFGNQDMDFSGLAQQLAGGRGADISHMKDTDFSDSDGAEEDAEEEEDEVDPEDEAVPKKA